MLVGLANAMFPVVIFTLVDTRPADEPLSRDFRFAGPGSDEVDQRVPYFVGNPAVL